MASVVRCRFLLISICLRSTSWADSMPQVTSLIGAVGNEIIIQCAADKTPQDGVYLYKQAGASKNKEEVFYYYKDGTLRPKSEWCRDNVKVTGTFPNLNVTILNLKATDTGFYWCEFNLEDTISVGTVTWLWIEESVDKNTNKTGEADRKDNEKVCSGDIFLSWEDLSHCVCCHDAAVHHWFHLCDSEGEDVLEEQEIQTIKSTLRLSQRRDETEQFGRSAQCTDAHQSIKFLH
ncbi:uncharacterized protein LOC132090974 isoform X2 [Carassius carassius]|uniref:uncharacterized protein LOC132090974 isoform X2 n=1 Tax=Carassius carassius TaxID=217509 RepID=UPI0028688669|nr:uncharacterized protein LOC132090974 isoform X2 [Carassius carassius]